MEDLIRLKEYQIHALQAENERLNNLLAEAKNIMQEFVNAIEVIEPIIVKGNE